MLRKLTSALLVILVLFSFAGCTEKPESSTTELVPYMADYTCEEENGYIPRRAYGLMTTDGKQVAQPIYNSYQTFQVEDKTYYCLKILEGDWEPICHNSLLVSSDGSFRLELKDNIMSLSENRIICQQFEQPFNVYDYGGNLLFSGNEYQTVDTDGKCFYNGLLVIYDFLSEDNYMTVCDENGQTVFERFDYCGPFVTNKAVAAYNREEGYGIISADGKWLLEPVYNDIQTVGGKYFIATDNTKEYIYDSELKLLRERECDTLSLSAMNYFFEINGKLIKFYSHMSAPDEFFRDAFTDEIISCKGLNATAYSENLGCFTATDELSGRILFCDENGKLLSERSDTAYTEDFDGAYCYIDDDGTRTYYNAQTHKQLLTLPCKKDEWKTVTTAEDCGLLTVADLEYIGDNVYTGKYRVYDYNKQEFVFTNCNYCEIKNHNGRIYLTVVYDDRTEVYDSELNLIIKTEKAA